MVGLLLLASLLVAVDDVRYNFINMRVSRVSCFAFCDTNVCFRVVYLFAAATATATATTATTTCTPGHGV